MQDAVLSQPTQKEVAATAKWSRQVRKLHLYAGVGSAFFVAVLGLSGALLAFQDPIDRALNPKLSYVKPTGKTLPLASLVSAVQAHYPAYVVAGINLPEKPEFSTTVAIHKPGSRQGDGVAINEYTGEILGDFSHSNHFIDRVRDLHTSLLLGGLGEAMMWFVGVFLTFLALSGVTMWWKRKRYWIGRDKRADIKVLDLHSAIGVYAALFVFLFGVTAMRPIPLGLVMKMPWTQPGFKVPAQPGVPTLTPEETLAIARQALPEARAEWVEVPRSSGGPVGVAMRYPEDHSRIPRSAVFINPYTGKIVAMQDSRKMSVFAKYAAIWNWGIHTGSIFGLPTQILMSAMSLVTSILALTGVFLWWKRKTLSV